MLDCCSNHDYRIYNPVASGGGGGGPSAPGPGPVVGAWAKLDFLLFFFVDRKPVGDPGF